MNTSAMQLNKKPSERDGGDLAVERVRAILQAHGRLSRSAAELADNDDLYEAGMTSLASVNVMLALEGQFDIEFPDQMLNRSVFGSIAAIVAAVRKIEGT